MIEPIDLHALADGELSAERASQVRQALDSDAAARCEYESIQALKQTIQTRAIRPDCQSEWRACVERIRELEKNRRVDRVVHRYAWALCGLFFLVILGAGITNRGRGQMGGEELLQAATSLVPTRTPPSKDGAAMNAYLDAMLGEASQSLAPERLQLLGGAVGEIDGHRAARLTLRDASGDMALLVVSDELRIDGMPLVEDSPISARAGSANGMNMIAWQFQESTAILIGDRSHGELADLAQRISIR